LSVRAIGLAYATKLRTISAAVAVVAVTAVLAPAGPALAHSGYGVPGHVTRYAGCFSGTSAGRYIQARPPLQLYSWFGGIENVYWTARLFQYSSRYGWLQVGLPGPNGVVVGTRDQVSGGEVWLHAAADRYGLHNINPSGIWLRPNNFGADNGLFFGLVQNLYPGVYYAIKEYYYWASNDTYHNEWQPFGPTSTICLMNSNPSGDLPRLDTTGNTPPRNGPDPVGSVPTEKDQCKKDGWRDFPQFRNQGRCVSFVQRHR
jgi:hypothetical protein